MKLLLALMLILLSYSCATLNNGRYTRLGVMSEQPAELTVGETTVHIKKHKNIKLLRSSDTLVVNVRADSFARQYHLPPIKSLTYHFNVFTLGLGYLVDKNTLKKYEYPVLYIYADDSTASGHRHSLVKQPFRKDAKGQFSLMLSIPYLNSFYQQPQNAAARTSTGFLGIGIGAAYCYRDNRYVALEAGGVMDTDLPFPAPVDRLGEYERTRAAYLLLTNNMRIRRFRLGYGLSYSVTSWRKYYAVSIPGAGLIDGQDTRALGFALSAHFQTYKHFSIGLLYKPSMWQVAPQSSFRYESLTSLEFKWRFALNKGKR